MFVTNFEKFGNKLNGKYYWQIHTLQSCIFIWQILSVEILRIITFFSSKKTSVLQVLFFFSLSPSNLGCRQSLFAFIFYISSYHPTISIEGVTLNSPSTDKSFYESLFIITISFIHVGLNQCRLWNSYSIIKVNNFKYIVSLCRTPSTSILLVSVA